MEDRKILELFFKRDETAIEECDKKYGVRCRGVARSVLPSPEDAEECVSDTYLAAWNSIPPQHPLSLSAYLCRLTRNIGIDRLKALTAQKRGGNELTAVLDELAECVASPGSVEGELEARELGREINRFLHSLSQQDRSVFVCRYWLLLPSASVAARLGMKDAAVRMSLMRTRKKLQKFLSEEGLI